MLTSSAVEKPMQIVRKAHYRETLATDGQLSLFEKPKPMNTESKLYAILLHGKDRSWNLDFAQIVFPLPNCKGYLENRCIDLLKRYRYHIDTPQNTEFKSFEPAAKVNLKPGIKKKTVGTQ